MAVTVLWNRLDQCSTVAIDGLVVRVSLTKADFRDIGGFIPGTSHEELKMPSPFPGMDPYLEQSERWPDLHQRLIAYISEELQPQLLPK